ncbi:hypothetical protein MASR1M90_00010 [Desulfovibrionales bacterium]
MERDIKNIYKRCFAYNSNVASSYDSDRELEEHWVIENKFIEQKLYNKNLNKILDIPVGTGRFLKFYNEVKEVIGVDISDSMLDEAYKKIKKDKLENIKLVKGDAFNLKFHDNHFDYAVCFRLLHLVPQNQRLKILLELKRVSKNIILQVYLNKKNSIFSRVYNKIRRVFSRKQDDVLKPWSHIKSYSLSRKELLELFEFSNLNIISSVHLCDYLSTEIYIFELQK